MRILQISSHYNQGGAARIAACIHRQLLKEGEEAYVAFGRGEEPEEQNLYRFGRTPEIYASAAVSRFAGVNGWSNRAATGRLLRYIDRVKPQVLHLHALHGYYLNFPLFFQYINERRLPCVWTFHDCHAFTGNCGYFFDCDKWKEGCGGCPHIQTYPRSEWFDFSAWMWRQKKELFTQGDRKVIVTPSEWLTREAETSFFGKYECMTIRNGIDTENTFYPRDRKMCRKKHGYGEEEKLVLGIAVGFEDERKGGKYIVQMARDLGSQVRILLVGWNEKNNDMLAGCENIDTLPPTKDAGELAEYYSMADVFVLPSLAENYATVTLESMACGTPVAGFDVGGIPEQLKDNRGIVVRAGDQKAFDEAVLSALQGTLKHGRELAELIASENSVKKMVEEYKKVYRKVIMQ